MYLDDFAEANRSFKVVSYTDHRQDESVRYYDDYNSAFQRWRELLNRPTLGRFTATAVIINVKTGEPVLRQSWRV